MTAPLLRSRWLSRLGWVVVAAAFVAFGWGLNRRASLEASGETVIRMLFVPSVEQGVLVERGDELARFVYEDSGLTLKTEVPTSYAAVIQALGSGQADVAWMPAFAYVIANSRYGAEARLQVVRSKDIEGIVVTRDAPGEPATLADLAGEAVAVPSSLADALSETLRSTLDREAPGWTEVPVATDKEAVRLLLESPLRVAAAVSTYIASGPRDFVGDGRKELEYDRPGTIDSTRIVYQTEESVQEDVTYYHGCLLARTDGNARRIEDFTGSRFGFSDETSTSGHIFPRMLLDRHNVTLGRSYFAGSHPNVVQAVDDGSVDGGAAFYSPPNRQQREEGLYVGDARYIVLRRMQQEERLPFLENIRILALTDPIPNDVCAARRGLPPAIWERLAASLQRYFATPTGQEVLMDILAGVGAAPIDDSTFDGFREALRSAGVSAEGLLEAAEAKLKGDDS